MLIMTTSYDPPEALSAYAKALAAEMNITLVERGRHPISYFRHKFQTRNILVVTAQGLKFMAEGQPDYIFHPSLAQIRCKRWLNGERDTMLACSGAMPGDHVLDCTAGMGSDAIVFALQAGVQGQVTAVESEFIPYLLAREGMRHYVSDLDELNAAMRRVQLIQAEHLTYMQQLPSKSVDIVYFDPMFRKPVRQSSAMEPLRLIANESPLSPETIQEASRVARKSIVMKEHRNSDEFRRLGFSEVIRTQSNVAYGVIKC